MKIASVDIGSNTVILLIVEIENKSIIYEHNYYRIGKLGKNLIRNGLIADERIEILFNILDEFNSLITKHNCNKILFTATNALRIASNGTNIGEKISNKFGVKVNIIDGELEATYSFIGATFNYAASERVNLVIDIGGGSTEIIIGNKQNILFRKSFQIGTVSLTDKFITESKPNTQELVSMANYTRNTFGELKKITNYKLTAVGVGGTPTSLSGMQQNMFNYDEKKLEGSVIYRTSLNNLSEKLSMLSSTEILERYKSIVVGRNDVIYAGSLILKTLLEIFNLNEIIISGKGLRYGVVYSKYIL